MDQRVDGNKFACRASVISLGVQ